MDLSIIIVSHNSKDLLRNCLRSVYQSQTRYGFDVLVHDNASVDQTPEMVEAEFPNTKLIRGENVGFSKANNAGIKQSQGRYVLLLNPDTEVSKDTFETMINFMDSHPDVGISTCKLALPDGTLDKACRRSFPTPWVSFTRLAGLSKIFPKSKIFNKYNLGYLPETEEHEIDSCVGAFLLTRRVVIEKVGLLDENFFLYGEDIDFCFRAKNAGWKVYYYSQTTVIHHKRQSSKMDTADFNRRAFREFYKDSMLYFYRKNLAPKYPWILNQLMAFAIRLHYVMRLALKVISSKLAFLRIFE